MANKKLIIGIVVVVLIALGAVAAVSGRHKTDTADLNLPPATAIAEDQPAPVTPAPATPALDAKATPAKPAPVATPKLVSKSSIGMYYAECLIPGAGTLIGQVDEGKGDPYKEKDVEVKNMNTGKSSKVTLATATCTFTPIEKKK